MLVCIVSFANDFLSFTIRHICLGLLLLCLASLTWGQTISITKGTQFPDTIPGIKYHWFLHTDSMQAYAFKHDRWVNVSNRIKNIKDLSLCNELVILHYRVEDNSVHTIYHPSGHQHESVFDYFCGEKIIVQRNPNGFLLVCENIFHGSLRNDLSMQYDCDLSEGDEVVPDTVQGMLAFCAPHKDKYEGSHWYCKELRSWGIIDVNSNWLIEPKFDKFFYFNNGIAEVLYQGKKRRINEKGKFVR
jgi:hypothetical protein